MVIRKYRKINHCIDCDKNLVNHYANRCVTCWYKYYKNMVCRKSLPKCIECNKQLGDYRSKRCQKHAMLYQIIIVGHPAKGITKKLTLEHRKNISLNHANVSGINNPNYKHGNGNVPYPLEFSEQLKESIRKRDNHTCQNCGKTQKQELKDLHKKISVHHIDYNKFNCKENNLITLCERCNIIVNSNINYWFAYFTYIMEKSNA